MTEKVVEWEGDSLETVKLWPDHVKANIGGDLRRLQRGEKPLDWKPFPGLRRKAFELRDRDKDGWYRVLYVTIIKGKIHVLHSFRKKSAQTSEKDKNVANVRLKDLLIREK